MTDIVTRHGALSKLDAHIWEREENEHYVEPLWTSARLFEEEAFVGTVQDPACGFGTIVKAAKAVGLTAFGTDLVDRGFADLVKPCRDFLSQTARVDNVVTNPPFDIAPKFALHALSLAFYKVAIIFPVARLNAAHWLQGTPLRRIWLMTPRPSMPPGHVIASGGKPGGGKMDYAWLVFSQGYSGTPELCWLRRDKALQ